MKQQKPLLLFITGASLTLAPFVSNAGNDVKWNGFLNVIATTTDSATNYLEELNDNGSFDHTSFGLNASKRIDAKTSITAQLFGHGNMFGFDWGYVTHRFNDNITGKAGKIKYAGNLISETIDIGVTYPWVRPPEAIYSESSELNLKAYTGSALSFVTGDETEFGAEIYAGEFDDKLEANKKALGVILSATSDNIRAQFNFNTSTIITKDTSDPSNEKTKTFASAGIRAEYDIATVYAEYSKSEVSDLAIHDRSGWYVTVLHDFDGWTPHLTYQSYETVSGGPEQTSVSLGLNRQIDYSTVLKFELQQVDPKNKGLFESQPTENKVNVLNLSLNMIF